MADTAQKLTLTWYRKSEAPRLEDESDKLREDAVKEFLDELDGVDVDSVEYRHPPRHLGADPGLWYQVCTLIVENIPEYYLLYKAIDSTTTNKVEGSKEVTEAIDEAADE